MSQLPLIDPEQAGVFYLPVGRAAALRQQAESAHFAVQSAVLGHVKDFHDALEKLGTACEFPEWYGANFDALFDCLLDPEWKPATGHVLFIEGCAHLRQINPDDFSTLLEVLLAAVKDRRETRQPLWILLDTPARGIARFPDL